MYFFPYVNEENGFNTMDNRIFIRIRGNLSFDGVNLVISTELNIRVIIHPTKVSSFVMSNFCYEFFFKF